MSLNGAEAITALIIQFQQIPEAAVVCFHRITVVSMACETIVGAVGNLAVE